MEIPSFFRSLVLSAIFWTVLQFACRAADSTYFTNNVFVGYQAWYNTANGPYNHVNGESPQDFYSSESPWNHWSATFPYTPYPNQNYNHFTDYTGNFSYGTNDILGFEQWPDMSGYSMASRGSTYDSSVLSSPVANLTDSNNLPPDGKPQSPTSLGTKGFQGTLGNGLAANLFTSYKADLIDYHFTLMHDNNIDGAAVQRFYAYTFNHVYDPANGLYDQKIPTWRQANAALLNIKTAAENHQRVFFIEYDMSYGDYSTIRATDNQAPAPGNPAPNAGANWVANIENDWSNYIASSSGANLVASSSYAKSQGLPVVGFFGFGSDHTGSPPYLETDVQNLISWFHQHGVYVYMVAPFDWMNLGNKANYFSVTNTWDKCDCLGPWTANADSPTQYFASDAHERYNVAPVSITPAGSSTPVSVPRSYMPVITPGFSASNSAYVGTAAPVHNARPRNEGQYLWQQVAAVRSNGIPGAFVAMFDEFNEGTAIAPYADSSVVTPVDNQFFLTTSADGQYVSSDFYLRLVGAATNEIKHFTNYGANVPSAVPLTAGPVWYRTGFEPGRDAIPVNMSAAQSQNMAGGYGGSSSPVCQVNGSMSESGGTWSLLYSGRGTANTHAYQYYVMQNVNIKVSPGTCLSFYKYATDPEGLHVTIDLIMTDGSTLRDSGAVDQFNNLMHPTVAKGAVNVWSNTSCKIGQYLGGKTIMQILVAYENTASTGDYLSYIDNVVITDDTSR